MGIKIFSIRKEIFKVGYQKPKSSPLQGTEPGSFVFGSLAVKKKKEEEKVHPWRELNPGLCAAKIVFADGLHP